MSTTQREPAIKGPCSIAKTELGSYWRINDADGEIVASVCFEYEARQIAHALNSQAGLSNLFEKAEDAVFQLTNHPDGHHRQFQETAKELKDALALARDAKGGV